MRKKLKGIKVFKSMKELKPYRNEESKTFEFVKKSEPLDIQFDFDFDDENFKIYAGNIKALNINAKSIKSRDIEAIKVTANKINVLDASVSFLTAKNVSAMDVKAKDIKVENISAHSVYTENIIAKDVDVENITAKNDIKADNIVYSGVCFAFGNIICKTIKGNQTYSRQFCLDGEIIITEQREPS